ncbi:MAG: hypothetical protein WA666_06605 [Nitrospirota bacterium]
MHKFIFFLSALIALASPASAEPAAPIILQRFDRNFSPALLQVSQFNSNKELLAVQMKEGTSEPGQVIAIDRRGKTRVVEDLTATKEVTVPGSRLWIAGIKGRPASKGKATQARRISR